MKAVVLKNIVQSLTLVSAAAFGSSAFAAATWTFGNGSPASECTLTEVGGAGCTGSTAGAPSLKVTAYSSTGSGGAFAAAGLNVWDGNGLAVQAAGESTAEPYHAMDNNGTTDLILLDFGGAKVDLDRLTIGYKNTDADISVFRYTGSAANPLVTGLTAGAMTGWTLVGNYADLVTNTAKAVNSKNETSSWWVISAYNTSYGAASESTSSSTGLSGGNDYFKVLSIVGTVPPPPPPGVPEPGTLALMGIAMAGFVATRRRKSKAV